MEGQEQYDVGQTLLPHPLPRFIVTANLHAHPVTPNINKHHVRQDPP